MDIKSIIEHAKIKCKDMSYGQALVSGLDLCQLKYDGWWCLIVSEPAEINIYSSGCRQLYHFDTSFSIPAGIFVGEAMYGTNWSSRFADQIFVHDCVKFGLNWTWEEVYRERYQKAERFVSWLEGTTFPFRIVTNYVTRSASTLWDSHVIIDGFEGLVYKSSRACYGASYGRTKRLFTKDFVCTGIAEGAGRLTGMAGSIEGSQYDENNNLVPVNLVGGGLSDGQRREIWQHKDIYIGKVFEAQGQGVFPSGSLRHPGFLRWRGDKLPQDCKK